MSTMTLGSLREFVQRFTVMIERDPNEPAILTEGGALLKTLIDTENWLPDYCAQPSDQHYQQYLLHCDPLERFSVVSFVWGGGQQTPIHNHTVWGLVGVLQGAEISTGYTVDDAGSLVEGPAKRLARGDVETISPSGGDIHRVMNAYADRPSISIHVYGANIGRVERSIFRPGQKVDFVSGYANIVLPNIWSS